MDDSSDNTGDTYASTFVDYYDHGPAGGVFVRFRQDGSGVELPSANSKDSGTSGQYDRWCSKLNEVNFAGKSGWRRTTHEELLSLFNYENPIIQGCISVLVGHQVITGLRLLLMEGITLGGDLSW
jgi:hypothetical protein